MTVIHLEATNFRNLTSVSIDPSPGVNVLCGDNAQGKTNLIEAVWMFTGARSFRGAKDAELIKFGQNLCRFELSFTTRGSKNSAALAIGSTKQATLNGIKLDSTAGFAGNFCCVVFSPEHLDLVKSGPQLRRRFLDAAISEILPRYAAALLEYREILRQRNALLKDIPQHSELFDTLSVWDERLAHTGTRILFTRLRYLKRLSAKAAEVYAGIASKPGKEAEPFALSYAADVAYPDDLSDAQKATAAIRNALTEKIASQRTSDIDSGFTNSGPHRDDMEIVIGGTQARLFASQGQQRSAVLALKLAEAAVLQETIGESPVLLLDDVMSELDHFRQDYILNHIGGCQVFITCCDPAGLEGFEDRVFEVRAGEITQRT